MHDGLYDGSNGPSLGPAGSETAEAVTEPGPSRAHVYDQKLRAGVHKRRWRKQQAFDSAVGLATEFKVMTAVRADAQRLQRDSSHGGAIQVIEEGESVPLWMQANAELNTEESYRKRFRLRQHEKVLAALDRLWQCALRSIESSGTIQDLPVLHFPGYCLLMKRVYPLLVETFDDSEAEQVVWEDWEEDCKGEEGLSCERFCDAFFE